MNFLPPKILKIIFNSCFGKKKKFSFIQKYEFYIWVYFKVGTKNEDE